MGSRKGNRSTSSRDSSMSNRMNFLEPKEVSRQDSQIRASHENTEESQKEVHVINQECSNHETSLRHFFYLEYKTKFPDGTSNPIVYSRFGKKFYDSQEKFDTQNFNQLIRTCNLKKLLKAHELNRDEQKIPRSDNLHGYRKQPPVEKFSEPMTFPTQDYYTPKNSRDRTLVFESRFESGNLQLAHKQNDNEYDLILQNDVNSKGHTQWFYFRVANTQRNLKVKFNMLNMIKSKSLYNDGMKVLIYSQKRNEGPELPSK